MKTMMPKLSRGTWDIFLKSIIRLTKADLQHKGFPTEVLKDDDLFQEAWTALGRANKCFDPEKASVSHAKFSTYAHKFVFHELRKFMYKQTNIAYTERGYEDISEVVTLDFVPNQDGGNGAVERKDLLSFAMRGLDSDEIQMISLYYVDDLSYRDIQKVMNISYTTVRNKMSRCLDKMRRKIRINDENYHSY